MKNFNYYFFRSLWNFGALLPFKVLYLLSDIVYLLVYYIARYRRKVVRKNLVNSFPERTIKEIVQIEKKFYAWFCDFIVEILKVRSISNKQMCSRMTFDGLDEIYQHMEENGQTLCFAYLGHYCNWEWITSLPLWTKDKFHCAQIYHPLENETMNRLMLENRGKFGSESIAMNDTLRRIVRLQKEGKKTLIGFISDQTPHWNSIHLWMDFLNQETPVFTGAERIAKQMNVCSCYIDIECKKRGYYNAHFKLIKVDSDVSKSEYPITETYMRLMEESIKKSSPYWLWSHNRWKRKRVLADKKVRDSINNK